MCQHDGNGDGCKLEGDGWCGVRMDCAVHCYRLICSMPPSFCRPCLAGTEHGNKRDGGGHK